MMKLITVSEMLAVERASDAAGHSYSDMMECAGKSFAEILHERFGKQAPGKAIAFVGKGNNGGDALIALTYLCAWGWQAGLILVGREMDEWAMRAEDSGCSVFRWPDIDDDAFPALLAKYDLLIDGLLGTGIRLPLRPPMDEVLTCINKVKPAGMNIAAVDTPSGVDCRTGEAAPETLAATLTVTMAAAKAGLFAYPAANFVGDLLCGDIGLSESLETWCAIEREVVDEAFVRDLLPDRPRDAHKGTFGTAVICAGSKNYVGAALLAGKAAFRVGAGLVTTACVEPVYQLIAGQFPESTWIPLTAEDGALCANSADELLPNLSRAQSLLIGPGFGLANQTLAFLERILDGRDGLPPLVVDADALKLLSRISDWPSLLPEGTILTPHPGEMAVMTGQTTRDIQQDRLGVLEKYAASWGHVVILKGAYTLIGAPDGRTALIPVSTPALARAGTGDVLAGIIAGLCAQGLSSYEAAVAGAWLHAQAGVAAEARIVNPAGVLAGDVLAEIAGVLLK